MTCLWADDLVKVIPMINSDDGSRVETTMGSGCVCQSVGGQDTVWETKVTLNKREELEIEAWKDSAVH